MKREIADKWTAALRSGKYRQCQGSLCVADKHGKKRFCCLGVLTDLFIKENGFGKWEREFDYLGDITTKFSFTNECGTLPYIVKDWAGMATSDGKLNRYDFHLAGLNDGEYDSNGDTFPDCGHTKNFTFKEIADIIDMVADEL